MKLGSTVISFSPLDRDFQSFSNWLKLRSEARFPASVKLFFDCLRAGKSGRRSLTRSDCFACVNVLAEKAKRAKAEDLAVGFGSVRLYLQSR